MLGLKLIHVKVPPGFASQMVSVMEHILIRFEEMKYMYVINATSAWLRDTKHLKHYSLLW